jgi:hypothetical protein
MTSTAAVELIGRLDHDQEIVHQAARTSVALDAVSATRRRAADAFVLSLIVGVQGAWFAALAYGAWLLAS